MLNTYIKNQGTTQTIIHDNNHNHFNEINWDADYDGNIANISFNSNTDGKHNKFNVSLDNEDLANILNIPSVNTPIDKRLKMDFDEPSYRPDPYFIELPTPELPTPELPTPELQPRKPKIIKELIDRRISSPLPDEELILPLSVSDKSIKKLYTLTPRKKHRRRKTHITYKVSKKPKSSTKTKSKSKSKSSTKTKSKSKSSTKTKSKTRSMKKSLSTPIVDLINSI